MKRRVTAWLKAHHRHHYRFVGMAPYTDFGTSSGPYRAIPQERSAFVFRCDCGDYYWNEVGISQQRQRWAS